MTDKVVLAAIFLLAIGVIGFFVIKNINKDEGGKTGIEVVMVKDVEVIGTVDEIDVSAEEVKSGFETKEITITNGVKHSVPLGEIRG